MDVHELLDRLLSDLGYGDASQAIREQMIERIQTMVDDEVMYALVSRIPKEKLEEIDRNLGQIEDPVQRVQAMMLQLKTAVPDSDKVIELAVVDLFDRLRTDADAVNHFLKAVNYTPPVLHQTSNPDA